MCYKYRIDPPIKTGFSFSHVETGGDFLFIITIIIITILLLTGSPFFFFLVVTLIDLRYFRFRVIGSVHF